MANPQVTSEKILDQLTLVKVNLPGFHSVTNFLAIRSGSRYEDETNAGIAHFLEHMVFKGTKKYPTTKSLAEAVESIGGYFNAWTSNDHTAYWNVVPAKHWRLGADIPLELAFSAILKEDDIERERGVIIEEIRMIQDDPARLVEDLGLEAVFPNHPLGKMIIGTEQSITDMKIKDFTDYRSKFYSLPHCYYVAVGNVENADYASLIKEKLADFKSTGKITKPQTFDTASQNSIKLMNKSTDQTHLVINAALPNLGLKNAGRFDAAVLNTILGAGMSSRLFLNVREKKGLAYAIHSGFQPFEDAGLISVYGGINTPKINSSLEAIKEEFAKLQNEKINETELNKAKQMIIGSFDLAHDDPLKLATWYGVSQHLGMKEDFEDAIKLVEKVTPNDIRELARLLLDDKRLSVAAIGPYMDDKFLRDFLAI